MGIRLTKRWPAALIVVATMAAAMPAQALQCVPYARAASGIDLRGDAWKWWNAAAGLYDRGHTPRVGAVMVFRKTGKMRLGHVAVITKVIGPRQVLIDHANWGVRQGERGRVAKMVAVRDISPHNDWSAVQVWNAETDEYGLRTYPTYGFIYPRRDSVPVKGTAQVDPPVEVAMLLNQYDPSHRADQSSAGPHPLFVEASIENSFVAGSATPAVVEPVLAVAGPANLSQLAPDEDHAAALRAGSGRY